MMVKDKIYMDYSVLLSSCVDLGAVYKWSTHLKIAVRHILEPRASTKMPQILLFGPKQWTQSLKKILDAVINSSCEAHLTRFPEREVSNDVVSSHMISNDTLSREVVSTQVVSNHLISYLGIQQTNYSQVKQTKAINFPSVNDKAYASCLWPIMLLDQGAYFLSWCQTCHFCITAHYHPMSKLCKIHRFRSIIQIVNLCLHGEIEAKWLIMIGWNYDTKKNI